MKSLLAGCLRSICCLLSFLGASLSHAETSLPHEHVLVHLEDKPTLQRGARIYMNYCAGCHSLAYVRYKDMARDIGIVDMKGHTAEALVRRSFIFNQDKITAPIKTTLSPQDAQRWFGVVPPDLSLAAQVHSADGLYTFLLNFYSDPKRQWGTNNRYMPDTAMPNVLLPLQGTQIPMYRFWEVKTLKGIEKQSVLDHLTLTESGIMTPLEFRQTVADLVTFLVYVSDPTQLERKQLGRWVLLFLLVWLVLLYLLKKAYWKDIH